MYYFHGEILTGDRSSFPGDSSSIFRAPLVAHLRFFIQADSLAGIMDRPVSDVEPRREKNIDEARR